MPTIADNYVTARGQSVPNMKHLVSNDALKFYLATGGGRGLAALCGRPVEWDEPVEPSRTCSRCLGKATGEQKRALTTRVTTK